MAQINPVTYIHAQYKEFHIETEPLNILKKKPHFKKGNT